MAGFLNEEDEELIELLEQIGFGLLPDKLQDDIQNCFMHSLNEDETYSEKEIVCFYAKTLSRWAAHVWPEIDTR
jgi:hypothetical protein